MKVIKVEYNYLKVKDKKEQQYKELKEQLSKLENTVYFIMKDDTCIDIKYTTNSIWDSFAKYTEKLLDNSNFKEGNMIKALLFEDKFDKESLCLVKNAFKAYFELK